MTKWKMNNLSPVFFGSHLRALNGWKRPRLWVRRLNEWKVHPGKIQMIGKMKKIVKIV